MTAPTLAQVDKRLGRLRATLEHTTEHRLGRLRATLEHTTEHLVQLDADVTRQMLEHSSSLSGLTARRWSVVTGQIAGLWRGQLALNAVLATLNAERGTGASVRRPVLVRISEQLDGRSVVLSAPETRPSLTEGLDHTERYSIDETVGMMSFAFDDVTATLGAVTSVWSEMVPRLRQLEVAVADGERDIAAVGGRPPHELVGLRSQIAAALEQAASDPLSVSLESLAPMEEGLERLQAAFRGAAEDRARAGADLDELQRMIDECERTIARAREQRQGAAAKILITAPAWEGVAEAERELAQLRGEWAEAQRVVDQDLSSAPTRLVHLRERAAQLRADTRALADADGLTVATRDELRGRLEALRAKAQARGRGEDLDLDRLFGAAEAVLYSAPCDLDEAWALVLAYQRAVGTVVIEDRR